MAAVAKDALKREAIVHLLAVLQFKEQSAIVAVNNLPANRGCR
jgi:hypothetical protein